MSAPTRRRKAGAYLSIYTTTLLGELAVLSLEAGGAYIRLLCCYWERKTALPDDDKVLAQLSGAGGRWKRIRPELAHLFEIGAGTWRHSHVDHEIAYFAHTSATQRAKVQGRWDRARAAALREAAGASR